jgi:hypothetical protein
MAHRFVCVQVCKCATAAPAFLRSQPDKAFFVFPPRAIPSHPLPLDLVLMSVRLPATTSPKRCRVCPTLLKLPVPSQSLQSALPLSTAKQTTSYRAPIPGELQQQFFRLLTLIATLKVLLYSYVQKHRGRKMFHAVSFGWNAALFT